MENRIPPRTEAVEKLENYITSNHLPPNTKIPSERDLCEMWGINRTTLRFAVDMLVESGQLYRKKGSGTYIAESKLVRNLLGVNSLSTEVRQLGLPFSTHILSLRVIECTKQVSKKLHIPLGQNVYECIRVRSIEGVPCIMETMYLDQNQCLDLEKYYHDKSSIYSIFENIYKKTLVAGEEKISVTYVSEEEAALLDLEEGEPVFFATGVTTMTDGVPLEYYKQLFRADRFKFVSMIKRRMT